MSQSHPNNTTTTPKKPTIVVIPGATCPSLPFYQPLCTTLTNKHGYPTQTADLPSASRSPPEEPATLNDDVQLFHEKIRALVEDDGEDVVVVAHSYGGMVATDAVEGLGWEEREKAGRKGGVRRIVYLSCIVAGVGETAGEVCARSGLEFKNMEPVGENGGFLAQVPDLAAAQTVFSDLGPNDALTWQSRQSLQSAICYTGKCMSDYGYAHIPVTYIMCTEDKVLPLDFQLGRVELLKSVCEKGLDVVRMKTGHCPNVSAVEETAEVIVRAIEGGGGKL